MLCIIYMYYIHIYIWKNKKKHLEKLHLFWNFGYFHILTHTHTLTHMHTHTHTCAHTHTWAHTHTQAHTHTHVHTHTHAHIHIHAHMHILKLFLNKKESMKSKHKFIPRPCRTKKRTQTRFPVLAKIEAGPFPEGNLSAWQMCSTLSSHKNSKLSHTDIATHWSSDSANTISTWNQELFQSCEMASLHGSAVVFSEATWSWMFHQCFACWCIIRSTVCWLLLTDNPPARCVGTAGRGGISDWENILSPFCFSP